MTDAGRVLVVANRIDPDAGYVGDRLVELGCTLVELWREDGLRDAVPTGARAVLLLGSSWSVADPVASDVLDSECALVRAADAAGVPVLGLCYGAQVVAQAHGGRVTVGRAPEVGLVLVETEAPEIVPAGPWWAFHSDVIEPPPNARVLATNSCGVQAFSVPTGLGVQFHPEVRPSVLEGWLRRFPALASGAGASAEELLARAVGHEAAARAAAYALVDDFLRRFPAGRGAQPEESRDASHCSSP